MSRISPVLVAVDVPLVGDERHKNWAKVVESVDDSKASGWAYDGEFIAAGGIQDVPAGSVILVYGERGSRANPQSEAQLFVANSDGTLSPYGVAKGRAWARTLRDQVVELLEASGPVPKELDWQPELMRYSDAALDEELRRRSKQNPDAPHLADSGPGTGDLGTDDLGTGDLGTGDLGTGDLGTGDLGTGDLGTGDQ